MQAGIHPRYGGATVRCTCGNTFATGSTKGDLRVELCNECHPFFTGKQKLLDTQGRIDRFRKKYANAPEKPVKVKKEAAPAPKKAEKPAKEKKAKAEKKEPAAKA